MITELLWEKVPPNLFISKEDFLRNLEDWKIVSHEVDGELTFVTFTKGAEFHFQSLGTGRSVPRGRFRAFLQNIIDEHGYAATRTPKDDVRQHRFNLVFGFTVTGEDEYDRHYKIERLRHA